jgi:hypothetical protein
MKKQTDIPLKNSSRRDFIKRSAMALGAFYIVPRHVLGGKGYLAPSDSLTKGIIGVGGDISLMKERKSWPCVMLIPNTSNKQ